MIISDTHRYVFIQNANTASSAMGIELKKNYAGEDILWKHARYEDFLKVATDEQKEYFVIAGIRNPLDVLVTRYFREKNLSYSHQLKGVAKNIKAGHKKLKLRSILKAVIKKSDLKLTNLPFENYIRKYYKNNKVFLIKEWSIDAADHILKYENLEHDFSEMLQKLELEQVGPLMRTKPTEGKDSNFLKYYTPGIREEAKEIFAEHMNLFGYTFPSDW